MKPAIKLVEPCNENRQVMPVRPANADLRSREYLTPAEIERLLKAAKDGRWGHRDATLIMVAYRHGLRELPARSANQTRRIKHGATSRSGRARRLEGARRQRFFCGAGDWQQAAELWPTRRSCTYPFASRPFWSACSGQGLTIVKPGPLIFTCWLSGRERSPERAQHQQTK